MQMLETMLDPRWANLAKVFCKSTKVKEGDRILLHGIDFDSLPLLRALQHRCLELGAVCVDYDLTLPGLERDFTRLANEQQIEHFPEWQMHRMQNTDVFMAARARANSLNMSGVPSEKISRRDKILRPIIDYRCDKTRWCITYVPTDHDAYAAGMSTPEYLDYFFGACLQDYAKMKMNQQALEELMEQTDSVQIIGPDTDLTFSIKGIPAKSCYGECNIPDGEVYTAPVRDSINGSVLYNVPSTRNGKTWTGVRLQFSDGKIIDARCDQDNTELNKIFDVDPEARYVGEFAIGTNPGINRPANNVLFDEKIFGSFHLTPGSYYDECPNGTVKSALHWDLVKILTPEYGGGKIFFDGEPIMINGSFVYPKLLALNPK